MPAGAAYAISAFIVGFGLWILIAGLRSSTPALWIRVQNWKVAFMEQHTEVDPKTPLGVWQGNFLKLRVPMLYNLRADPFERGPTSSALHWAAHRTFLLVPTQGIVARYLESFKDFPPRAKAASFTVSDVMEKISTVNPSKN